MYCTFFEKNTQNIQHTHTPPLYSLLQTHDGRKACLAAITSLDKTRGLKPWQFKNGLNAVAAATADDISSGGGKMATTLPLQELLSKYGTFKSTTKVEFKADRIILFGPDLYTARNIVVNGLIS